MEMDRMDRPSRPCCRLFGLSFSSTRHSLSSMSSLSVRLVACGAWVPFAVIVVLALLEGSGTHLYRAAFQPWYAIVFGLAGVGALAVGARAAWGAGIVMRDARPLLALGALLAWLLAWNRSLVASPWPDRAWLEALVPLGATGIGALAAVALARAKDPDAALRTAAWAVTLVGLVLAVRALALWLGATVAPELAVQAAVREATGEVGLAALPSPWRRTLALPFGHPNYVAAAAILLLPPAVALALAERGLRRLPGVLTAVLLAAVLVGSGSRAGLLALGVTVLAAAWLAVERVTASSWSRRGLLIAAMLIAIGLAASSPRVRTTAGLLASGDWREALDPGRTEMILRGWEMGMARVTAGWGAGSTPLVYPAFRVANEAPGLPQAHQLHCTPIQLWADHGLLGPLAAGMVLLAATCAWRRGRRCLGRDGRLLADGAALGALGAVTFGLTDYALDVPFLAAGLALLLGLAAGSGFHRRILAPSPTPKAATGEPENGEPDTHSPGTGPTLRRAEPMADRTPTSSGEADAESAVRPTRLPGPDRMIRLFGIITAVWLVCFGLLAAMRQSLVVITRHAAHQATVRADLPLADRIDLWDRAIGGAPTEPGHRHGRASLLTEAALAAAPEHQPALMAAAAEAWDGALAVWPQSDLAHFQAGWLRLATDPEAADTHFRAAARLVPEKTGVHEGLAMARRTLGDESGMIEAFALEWFCNPASALQPKWRDPLMVGLRARVEARLAELHEEAELADPSAQPEARDRRAGRALVRWWLTGVSGPQDRADLAAGRRVDNPWLAAALEPDTADLAAPPSPAMELAWLAWRGALPGDAAATASIRLVRREEPAPELAAALGNWLTQPDLSFPELLRSAPTSEALAVSWRTVRPAQPLLDRQEDRPPPFDVPQLNQEVPALLWVRPQFPAWVRPPPGLHAPWLARIGNEGRDRDQRDARDPKPRDQGP